MRNMLALTLGLLVIAVLFRVDFFFYLLYFFFGVYFLSRLWARRSLAAVAVERDYPQRAFLGERATCTLRLRNRGWLPIAWLRLHDSLPIQLKSPNFYRTVLSLMPHERATLSYELDCRRRGYYPLGPLTLHSGDLFGIGNEQLRITRDEAVIVFPQIVPLTHLGLPAQSPFGEVASKQRIYEDPARLLGVRDYQRGDSIRHIHWKATAVHGDLQVKRFEPAISVEAQILLDLHNDDYTRARLATASELAIVVAASIANHIIERRQQVGLACNGYDPLGQPGRPIILPPRKGRAHLMQILDVLARIELGEHLPYERLLRQVGLHLTWGGTAILVTPDADDALFERLLLLKRSGHHLVLVVTDPQRSFLGIQQRARQVGIRAYQIWRERDLDVWRQPAQSA